MTLVSKGSVLIVGDGEVVDSGSIQLFTDSQAVIRRVLRMAGLHSVVFGEVATGTYLLTARINPLFASGTTEIAELTSLINQAAYLDANLGISIAASANPYAGGDVTITVTVSNAGPHAASTVVGTVAIPSGLTLAQDGAVAAAGTTYNPTTGAWTIGTVPSGVSKTLVLTCTIDSDQGGETIAFPVSVEGADSDMSTLNNSASASVVVAEACDLSLAVTADDETPAPGADVVFTITVTNDGPDDASLIEGTFEFPATTNLVYKSKSVSEGITFDETTGVWTIAAVSATAGSNTASFTVTGTVSAEAGPNLELVCDASITELAEVDPDVTDHADSVTVTVTSS